MSKRKRYLRSNLFTQVATLSIAAGFLAGCSGSVERFGDEYIYTGSTNNQRAILSNGQRQPTYNDIVNGSGGTEAGLPSATGGELTTGSISSASQQRRSNIQAQPLPALSSSSSPDIVPVKTASRQMETMPAPEVVNARSTPAPQVAAAPVVSAPVQTQQRSTQTILPSSMTERSWKGWTSAGGTRVTVRNGDTLHSMSRRFGVPVEAVAEVNGINDPSLVRPGQTVVIPTYVYSDRNVATSASASELKPTATLPRANVPLAARKPMTQQVVATRTTQPVYQQPSYQQASVQPTYQVAAVPRPRPGGNIITGSIGNTPVSSQNSALYRNQASAPSNKPYRQVTFAELQNRQQGVSDASSIMNGTASSPKTKPRTVAAPAPVVTGSVPQNQSASISGAVPVPRAMPRAQRGTKEVVASIQPAATQPVVQSEAKPTAPIQPRQVAKAEPTQSGPMFRWPVTGRIISEFGSKPGGNRNEGINVAVPEGTPVKAADTGTVIYSGNELKGYGNLVLVRHSNGWVSAYAHNSRLNVKRGDKVNRGDVIANAGATGSVSSPQLHFELRNGNKPVDPMAHLPKG